MIMEKKHLEQRSLFRIRCPINSLFHLMATIRLADDLLDRWIENFSKLPLLKVNISHFFKPTILGFVNLFASTFFAL